MTTDYISGVIYVKPEVSAGYRPFYLRADMQSDCNGWLARAPNCTSGSTNTIRQMLADASMLLPLINLFPLLFRCNLLANTKSNGTQFGISVSFFFFFFMWLMMWFFRDVGVSAFVLWNISMILFSFIYQECQHLFCFVEISILMSISFFHIQTNSARSSVIICVCSDPL